MREFPYKSSQNERISRREFMGQLGLLASLVAVFPSNILAARRESGSISPADWIRDDPWFTLAAVQEHLFPAGEDVPGAVDFNAIVYLHNALEIEQKDKDSIINGAGWLNDLTQKEFKKLFAELNEQNRESVLRKIENSGSGRKWLSLMLTYLIEALLADPVYGGNTNGIGWKWLQHQPGFPRPTADKAWYRLQRQCNLKVRKMTHEE
ncbi:MAG: gluconate 2-dehydrogenase subunit 3 family protein [Gammaproteobacteria bacterium]|nr:gluconate 2-dehydrogenase subunit 3 family protein [Gammaproteobacteria bacterium]